MRSSKITTDWYKGAPPSRSNQKLVYKPLKATIQIRLQISTINHSCHSMLCAQDILRSCFAVHQRGKLWEAARRRLDSKTFEDLKRRLVLHWSSGYIAVVGGVVCKKKNMFITSTKHDSSSKHEHVSFEHVLSFAT